MIITCLSWIVISVYFLSFGFFFRKIIIKKVGYKIKTQTGIVLVGLVFCTIYAQTFSLFYKLGGLAIALLSFLALLSVIYSRDDIFSYIKEERINIKKDRTKYMAFCLCLFSIIIFASYLASRTPEGYDPYNYQIPAIRWYEEYGIVKGLGNLHTRFAYNSSFLALQALFSFAWIYGKSMHSMNCYIWLITLAFAVKDLFCFKNRRPELSDIFRLMCICILLKLSINPYDGSLSAPITNLAPVCFIAYVFIMWSDLNEHDEKADVPYGLLALFSLFLMSVKLSCAFMAIFAIKPLFCMINNKKFKKIAAFMLVGIIVIFPFIISNVILSGYLFYPLASVDIFNFDWEIPKSMVVSDSIAIKLFARAGGGERSFTDLQRGFIEWFKIWVLRQDFDLSIFAIINTVLSPIMLVMAINMAYKKKWNGKHDLILYITGAIGWIFLLFSAPSPRFGVILYYIIPILFICFILNENNEEKDGKYVFNKWRDADVLYAVIFSLVVFSHLFRLGIDKGFDAKIVPKEYTRSTEMGSYVDINGYKFYYFTPVDNENNQLNGYDCFPGTENRDLLEHLEFRGEALEEGFRIRTSEGEYIDYMGKEISDEKFIVYGLDKYYKR